MNVQALGEENKKLKEIIDQQALNNKALTEQVEKLSEQVRLLQILQFGSKSEKLDSEDKRQGRLFNEAEDGAFEQHDDEQRQAVTESREVGSYIRSGKQKAGRKALSEDLPREIESYDIEEEEKTCGCGTEKTCIGEDVSERLKVIPAKVVVIQERRKKYACRSCEGTFDDEAGVQRAEGPRHLISGSIADESLLAWSILEKFEYALPFYRQAKRLAHIGASVPRATLSTLAIKTAQACRPLYDLMREHIQAGQLINADETKVQVLKEPGRRAQAQSWMWVFAGGEENHESVVFQYETGRSHEVAYRMLKNYSGWLQSDDYEAYHTAVKRIKAEEPGQCIQHVLCWAHARRRFYQYWEQSKSEEAKDILEMIGELFELENLRSKNSLKGFAKQRRNRAGPILEKLKNTLMTLQPKVPPSLAFGKAISYTLSNWEQLEKYLENPHITPSNNRAENAIRPFVIGRKNWLFSATTGGAEASAILYSLVETAKLHRLSVYEYLYFILKKIPYCDTPDDYQALLPSAVTPQMISIPESG